VGHALPHGVGRRRALGKQADRVPPGEDTLQIAIAADGKRGADLALILLLAGIRHRRFGRNNQGALITRDVGHQSLSHLDPPCQLDGLVTATRGMLPIYPHPASLFRAAAALIEIKLQRAGNRRLVPDPDQ
jgi:hypothetical protein